MLEAGEIDLLSDVSYTAEREETMLFSQKPMGEEKYDLYADVSNTDISASDIRTINGKRVGINAGSVQTELFARWTQEHGVLATIVPISSLADAVAQMEDGSLDCVVVPESTRWMEAGMTGITWIGSSDIYFAVNKNRPDLKEELDRALSLGYIEKIETANGFLRLHCRCYRPNLTARGTPQRAWMLPDP